MRRWLSLTWLFGVSWYPWAGARADAPVPDTRPPQAVTAPGEDGAARLIEEGITQRKAGDDRAALESFQRAFDASGSPRALAQLALAEQALGRWLDAHDHLSRALASDEPWIVEHGAELRAALDAIRSELADLEVSCNVDGANVYIDGRWLGRTPSPTPFRIVAGQSAIQVTAPGYFTIARQVRVDAGELARIDVSLTPEPRAESEPSAVSPAPDVDPPAPRSKADAGAAAPSLREPLMYGSVGVGALGAAVGLTGYVIREVNIAVYNDDARCDVRPDVRRSVECASEASAWRTGQTLAIGGLAAAGVFGALAAYLWLTRTDEDDGRQLACSFGPRQLTCSTAF